MTELTTDTHRLLAAARSEGRLARDPLGPVVLDHVDVRAVLADTPNWSAAFTTVLELAGVAGGSFHDWMALSPLDHDGDDHRAWRSLMSRTFTPRQVEDLRPLVGERCHQLIDALPIGAPFDFMTAFASQLPLDALCALMGVPDGDRADFRVWADTIGLGFDLTQVAARIAEIDAALDALLSYARDLVARRRAEPRDDLVSRVAAAAAAGEVSDELAAGSVAGLVFAGHETTRNQLGTTYALLATLPGVWDDLADGRVTPRDAVEELLRLRGAVTTVGRLATADTEVAGCPVAGGTLARLSLWSANRDGSVHPDPDRYDPAARADEPHLAFGHGAHHCLGAALARLELTEAVGALTHRLETPEILDGLTWREPVGITGPATVPTVVQPRR